MQQVPDPYLLLGVERNASLAQIKAAHRALAKQYHPDAPGGDTVRFLQVQAAYDLLSNSLRRREWDARHAPGPMRAGQAAAARPRAANGRWTRAEDAAPQRPAGSSQAHPPDARRERPFAQGRDPSARTYTWSASEVPWWEEHGPRENRRQPGRQRPREADSGARAEPTQDFDVYNRSSGAAWSSAARAYFRRAENELPRRGSFQRQGTQSLTAARARMAAEEERRRNAGHGQRQATAAPDQDARPTGRPTDGPRTSASSNGAARPAASPADRERSTPAAADTARPSRPASDPAPRRDTRPPRPPSASPAQPAYAWAGVSREPPPLSHAGSAGHRASRAVRWPTLPERLALALLAWLPVATLVGYGGSLVTGCDRASVGCPAQLELVQSVLITLALGLLVILPRVAYVAAIATAGLIVAAMAIVVGAWFAGIQPPLPVPALAVVAVVLGIVYLATASWALADGPRQRPWAARRRTRYGWNR